MELIWSQVVTQIIGFLIALLILKKYAWGPVLNLLEERRQKIQGEFDKIESTKREIAQLKSEVETQLRNMEAQARARIQEAVQDGQRVATEITDKARTEARDLVDRAKEEIARDRDNAVQSAFVSGVESVNSFLKRHDTRSPVSAALLSSSVLACAIT